MRLGVRVLLFAGPELPEVELEFLALKDVAIGAAGLAGSAGDDSVKTTGGELVLKKGIDFGILLPGIKNTLDVVGALDLLSGLLGGGGSGGLALLCHRLAVVSLIPLPEGSSINLDDGAFDEGVCSDKLVVGSVVDNTNETSLLGDMFRGPSKVTRFQPQSPVLEVPTTYTNGVHTLGAELSACRLTAELELSLLAVVSALGTGRRKLVA